MSVYSRNAVSFTSKSRWKMLVELAKTLNGKKVWRVTIETWSKK